MKNIRLLVFRCVRRNHHRRTGRVSCNPKRAINMLKIWLDIAVVKRQTRVYTKFAPCGFNDLLIFIDNRDNLITNILLALILYVQPYHHISSGKNFDHSLRIGPRFFCVGCVAVIIYALHWNASFCCSRPVCFKILVRLQIFSDYFQNGKFNAVLCYF